MPDSIKNRNEHIVCVSIKKTKRTMFSVYPSCRPNKILLTRCTCFNVAHSTLVRVVFFFVPSPGRSRYFKKNNCTQMTIQCVGWLLNKCRQQNSNLAYAYKQVFFRRKKKAHCLFQTFFRKFFIFLSTCFL